MPCVRLPKKTKKTKKKSDASMYCTVIVLLNVGCAGIASILATMLTLFFLLSITLLYCTVIHMMCCEMVRGILMRVRVSCELCKNMRMHVDCIDTHWLNDVAQSSFFSAEWSGAVGSRHTCILYCNIQTTILYCTLL